MPRPPDPPSQNLDASIDALYRAELDRFTAERNALAAALKKSGDRDAAARVQALAKPSTTAWAVNQVWWRHRERFQAMLDAGVAQRGAHIAWAQGRAADVRAAGEARRQAVTDVTDAALQVLGGKKAVGPDVQYRVAGTVEALASSGVPEGETLGRLTKDLQSSGLDALTAMADAAPLVSRPTIVARGNPAAAASRARTDAPPDRVRAARMADAQARVATLTIALEAATQAAAQATAEEAAARDTLDKATRRRTDLEAALDDARTAEASARRALSSATTALSRVELDHARALRDATRAREALETLEKGP